MVMPTGAQRVSIAEIGVEQSRSHCAVAGACIKLALADAGSVTAYRWLQTAQCRRWVSQLGGDGYLDAALGDLGRRFRRWT